jgi:hypothetical protein
LKISLDRLLACLRDSTPDHARLPELESLIWQRIGSGEPPLYWRRLGLHLRLTAILGAFIWGILMGAQVSVPPSSEFLVAPAEFLSTSTDGLSFF